MTTPETQKYPQYELKLHQDLVYDYLFTGSVETIKDHHPFSAAQIHRILDDYEVIKSVGRNKSSLGLGLYFLTRLVQTRLPLETLYHSYMTGRFREKISKSTLHRILKRVKKGLVHSCGTALIISPQSQPDLILVGDDTTLPDLRIDKYQGALSTPMTYSQWGESNQVSIARVLQQEVFSGEVLNKNFTPILSQLHFHKVTTLKIADVKANVWHIQLPDYLVEKITSPKLKNLRFESVSDLSRRKPLSTKIRPGVVEMASAYLSYINYASHTDHTWDTFLNQELLNFASA